MKRISILALLFLSQALAKKPPLLSRDFSQELPAAVAAQKGRMKVILLAVGDSSEPRLQISMQVLGTTYLKVVTIDLLANPSGHSVSADLGHPINSGTRAAPIMQAPLKVTWSKSGLMGRKSRTDLYQLSALGCKKSQP